MKPNYSLHTFVQTRNFITKKQKELNLLSIKINRIIGMNETPVPIPQSENLAATNPFDDSTSQRSPASAAPATPGTPSSQGGGGINMVPFNQQQQMRGGAPASMMSPPPNQMMNDLQSPQQQQQQQPPGQFNQFGPGHHPGQQPGMPPQGHPGFGQPHPGMNGPGQPFQMNGQPSWQQVH